MGVEMLLLLLLLVLLLLLLLGFEVKQKTTKTRG